MSDQASLYLPLKITIIILGVVYLVFGGVILHKFNREKKSINALTHCAFSDYVGQKYTEDNLMFPNVFLPFIIATGYLIYAFTPYLAIQIINIVTPLIQIALHILTLISTSGVLSDYKELFKTAEEKMDQPFFSWDTDKVMYYRKLNKLDKVLGGVNVIMGIGLGIAISAILVMLVPFFKRPKKQEKAETVQDAPNAPNAPNAPIDPNAPKVPSAPSSPNASTV